MTMPHPGRQTFAGTYSSALNSAQANSEELAALDALAEELTQLGFPALRLTPAGGLPYVDTGMPVGMAPGERIYVQVGMFFWRTAVPISPSDQPSAAADVISRALRPGTPQI